MDVSHILTHFAQRIVKDADFPVEIPRLSDRHLVQIGFRKNNNHFTNRHAGSARHTGKNGV